MEIKRYSFPTEAKAKELILKLAHTENELAFNKITTTETTHAIVCLGFQNKYEDEVLVKEGLTYDVDVMWKDVINKKWNKYEVNVKTPNHNFA